MRMSCQRITQNVKVIKQRTERISIAFVKTVNTETDQRLKQNHLQFESLGGAAGMKQELRRSVNIRGRKKDSKVGMRKE